MLSYTQCQTRRPQHPLFTPVPGMIRWYNIWYLYWQKTAFLIILNSRSGWILGGINLDILFAWRFTSVIRSGAPDKTSQQFIFLLLNVYW